MLTHEMAKSPNPKPQGSDRQVWITLGVKGKQTWLDWLTHNDFDSARAFAAMWQAFMRLPEPERRALYLSTRDIKRMRDEGFAGIVATPAAVKRRPIPDRDSSPAENRSKGHG